MRADANPSVLCLSRQALPTFREETNETNLVAFGAYVVVEPEEGRDVTLIATGSEVSIALEAAKLLEKDNVRAAVVSAPCFELFRRQSREYRTAVLGRVPRVGVEAAVEGDWARGSDGGIHRHDRLRRLGTGEAALPRIRHHGRRGCKAALRCIARSRMAATYA